MRVRLFLGLVRFRVAPRGDDRPARPEVARDVESRPRRPRRRFSVLRAWRTEGAPDAARRLLRRLWRSVRLRALDLRARFGTGDPAETGRLVGLAQPALAAVAAAPRTRVVVEPDWTEERLEGRVAADARVWPALVLGAALAFLATPAVWRAFREGRRA